MFIVNVSSLKLRKYSRLMLYLLLIKPTFSQFYGYSRQNVKYRKSYRKRQNTAPHDENIMHVASHDVHLYVSEMLAYFSSTHFVQTPKYW